MQAMEKYRTLH